MLDLPDILFFSSYGDAMRISCPVCKTKAAANSRVKMSDDVDGVYAKCINADCDKVGHSFLVHVSFSHWIDPRVSALQLNMTHLFDQLPEDDKRDMLRQLQASCH